MKVPTLVTVAILFCGVVLWSIASPRTFHATFNTLTSWIDKETIVALAGAVAVIYGARGVHRRRRRRIN